ncbi:MAG: hypothetical protein ACJ746_28400 [Bryobacteraceae bacterium]
MEPSVEIYEPSPAYARLGWASLAGSAVCLICGLRAPLAFAPGALCALTAVVLFWLAHRPAIRIGTTQFNIGERAIAWQEVREINTGRFLSPLILKLKLTNSRRKALVFPGEPERIAKLLDSLRRHSMLATFNGIAYRDYWTWNDVKELSGDTSPNETPVRMVSAEDEDEIERLFQKLKNCRDLDSHDADQSRASHED